LDSPLVTAPRFISGVYTESLLSLQYFFLTFVKKAGKPRAVPNKRSAGQKLLNLSVDAAFIDALDKGITARGYANRSEFIREAITEKLQRLGINVPRSLIIPPSRIGKGGPTKYTERSEPYVLNEKPNRPSSKRSALLKAAADEFAGEDQAAGPVSPKKP
jgi:hypothetical protein